MEALTIAQEVGVTDLERRALLIDLRYRNRLPAHNVPRDQASSDLRNLNQLCPTSQSPAKHPLVKTSQDREQVSVSPTYLRSARNRSTSRWTVVDGQALTGAVSPWWANNRAACRMAAACRLSRKVYKSR